MKIENKKRAKPGTEEGLDFTSLPIDEVVQILRRVGMRMLSELLAPPWFPGKALPVKPIPELTGLLTRAEVKTLSQAHVWKLRRKYNFKTGRIPGRLREELPLAFKKIFPKCIKGKISATRWQIAACNRMALALGGTKGDVLPDNLWLTTAESAWNNPEFKLTVAMKIHAWLRQMRLFVPYELPVVLVSPITFWVLIALANVKPLKFIHWFSKTQRAALRICRRLQQEAQLQMMKNQWAGFWEQWIIQLASQRWPSAFSTLENRLCKALLSLPLLRTTEASTLCKKKRILRFCPWPLIEKWFDVVDGIKRLRRSKNEFRRIALLNFSAPDWNRQMPDFFASLTERDENNKNQPVS